MFRLLILALACLPLHHAMAQMPGAVPGGWNGSVALPAPSGLSMPSTLPLAHFAPLTGPGQSVRMSPYTGQEHGQADSRDMQPASPMIDNDAQRDWNAFQRTERQVLQDMHHMPPP
ncbi:hypothetical protein [Komagataeibacter diospyri]|uniref:hypothetical protein n=1 Tax=Komagataeibacter diospyri TaxID=1932662 RepID=UPI003757B909